MPKMKTHKGSAKRFRLTSKGKVRHKRSFSGHLMSGKTGSRCRNMRRSAIIEGAIGARIRRALGG